MKKMTMICMAALLVTAMSCKKEKVENTAVGAGFRATLEAHAGDSKTHLDGLSVKWDLGDAVTVVNANDVAKTFVISAIHDDYSDLVPAEGEGVTDAFYKPNYKAYYPSAIYDAGQVSLPQTQDYATGSFGKGFNPMAAYAVNKNLDFKNLCGLLALQLTGDCEVKSITITSKKDEMLWGKGELTLSSSAATLGTLTEGGSSITLNCYVDNEYVQLSGTATTFYFVVPAGTLSDGFDVLLTDSEDKFWRRSASQNTTINQNKIRTMSELAVETYVPVKPSTVTLTAGCSDEFIYNVGGSITVPEGTHTCEFGFVYSATNAEPTVDNGTKIVAGTATFSDTKTFAADLTGLTVGTTYHVRAYAMIDGVTYSSTVKNIVGGSTPLPLPSNWTNGKSPHPFTVGMDGETPRKVYFSQGNLQYIGSAGTWKFADHQFDFFGTTTGQNSAATNVDRDLFGWGDLTGCNTSETYSDYSWTADWGTKIGSGWRTLTGGNHVEISEWKYLIVGRPDADNLHGEGKVGNCTLGLIILPDDWKWEGDVAEFGPNVTEESRRWKPGNTAWNVYSYSEWAKMEAAGAVFLPAAGQRDGASVSKVGSSGNYWSSGPHYSDRAFDFRFDNGGTYNSSYGNGRYYGFSVRLVSNVAPN